MFIIHGVLIDTCTNHKFELSFCLFRVVINVYMSHLCSKWTTLSLGPYTYVLEINVTLTALATKQLWEAD